LGSIHSDVKDLKLDPSRRSSGYERILVW